MNGFRKFRDITGKLKFFTRETGNRTLVCRSDGGKAVGFTCGDFSYKITGKKISIGSDPALLFEEEYENKKWKD